MVIQRRTSSLLGKIGIKSYRSCHQRTIPFSIDTLFKTSDHIAVNQLRSMPYQRTSRSISPKRHLSTYSVEKLIMSANDLRDDLLEPLRAANPLLNVSIEEDEDLQVAMNFSNPIVRTRCFVNNTALEKTSINYTISIVDHQVIFIITNISLNHVGHYKLHAWDTLNQTNQSVIVVHVFPFRTHLISCQPHSIYGRFTKIILCVFRAKHPRTQW